MEHFREALRLDPQLEWARLGIIEAMKARYFVYRIMLNWFLWMMKLSGRAQWGVIIGAYIGYRVLQSIARNNPALAPWIFPLLVAYVSFVVLTWVASPLFNLLLRLNRFGRLALSREEILTSNWVGLCVVVAIGALIAMCFGYTEAVFVAAVAGFLIPPISRIYDCDVGWPRLGLTLVTLALAAIGATSIGLLISGAWLGEERGQVLTGLGFSCFVLFAIGAFGSQFAANAFAMATPRR